MDGLRHSTDIPTDGYIDVRLSLNADTHHGAGARFSREIHFCRDSYFARRSFRFKIKAARKRHQMAAGITPLDIVSFGS